MALEWLLDPVSEDSPCGPDLEQAGDPEFLDYYYEAEARLPERYFVPGVAGADGSFDRVFDPKSVNLRAETDAITALLRRSRDLRPLSLLARFQILSGRLADFGATLTATADLFDARPDVVNPVAVTDRRAALDALGTLTTVIMPLHHLPLTGHLDTTYRRWLVATGQANPREDETNVQSDQIISALASPANRQAVDRVHGDLGNAARALSRIATTATNLADGRFKADVQETLKTLGDMQTLIGQARPDLPHWTADAPPSAEPATDNSGDAVPTGDQAAPVPTVAPVASGPAAAITNRAMVRAALESVEKYLALNEPSSPALLLVTQARLLIGRPLIEALETLLPADAGRALIGFAPETGFSVSMERMRALSKEVLGGFETPPPAPEEPAADLPPPASRGEAGGLLRGVEEFYQKSEPASPIPILLARARGFMDKGFQSIVAELIPRAEPKG